MRVSRKEIFHKIFLLLSAAIIFHAVWIMVADDLGALRFFTVLSNLLLGVAFVARVLFYRRGGEFLRHLSFAALIAIIVTCVVYNFVLVPFVGADNIFQSYANFVTHFLSLVIALANYVFFEPKGELRRKHALAAIAFPAVYWAVFVTPLFYFTPYFFMNPAQIGWGTAILWFAGFLVAFAGIAFGLVWVDSSAEASRIFRIIVVVFLGIVGVLAAIAALLFGGLILLLWSLSRPPIIAPEREFFALENSTDIPAEGINAEPGISLYVSLRGNGIAFQTHDRNYILVTYRLCRRTFYHHPVYEFTHDENGAWLRIADEIRSRSALRKNSSGMWGGEITIFVPENSEQVFYVAEITEHDMSQYTVIPDGWRSERTWGRQIPLHTIAGRIYLNGEEYHAPQSVLSFDPQNFTGWWHGSPGVPAGFADRYYFGEDGTFIFITSDMDGATRERAFSGSWEESGGQVFLTVKNRIDLLGGNPHPAWGSFGSDYVIDGGTRVYTALAQEDFFVMQYEISDVFIVNFYTPFEEAALDCEERTETNFARRSVRINGRQFWFLGIADLFEAYFNGRDSFPREFESPNAERTNSPFNYLLDVAGTQVAYFCKRYGIIPVATERVAGTEISFDFDNFLLGGSYFDDVDNLPSSTDWVFSDFVLLYHSEHIVTEFSANEPLTLLDVRFILRTDRYEPYPWVKVQTQDGLQGWLRVIFN